MTALSLTALSVAGLAAIAAFVFVRSLQMPATYEKNRQQREALRKRRAASSPAPTQPA